MKLNTCNVVFDPTTHTYRDGEKIFSGITGVIKERVCPDLYKDVPEYILRRAAEEGTRMHNACELYEATGIETEGCPELQGYIAEKCNRPELANYVASEYLVTDNNKYASSIDLTFEAADGTAILVDLKRTSVLNIEYVSWQLSAYAAMFEAQNPEVKVSAIYALHLRGEKHELVPLERKSADLVHTLLYTQDPLPMPPTDCEKYPTIASAEAALAAMKAEYDEVKARYDEITERLKTLMADNGIKKYEGRWVTMTKRADSVRTTFDSKAFKADHPDIYEQYTKKSLTEGGITIKVKE